MTPADSLGWSGFNVSVGHFFGVALYNPGYASLPVKTGGALFSYGPNREEAFAHLLQIDPRARAEETLHELLAAHVEAEDRHRQLAADRHMLGDIHRQRGFAHARTRRDHHHFTAVQAVRHAVELVKSCWEAAGGKVES